MDLNNIHALYQTLKTSRSRFGIWLCEITCIGDEENVAVLLGAEAVDLADLFQQQLEPDSDFIGLDNEKLTDLVKQVCLKPGKENVLVYNIDLLLAKMAISQRSAFWDILLGGMVHLPRSLVFMLPSTASILLPSGAAKERWKQQARIITKDIA